MSSDISVVVIVHGRHDHLRRTLASLGAGEVLPDEAVVVAMADPAVRGVIDGLGTLPVPVRAVDLDGDPRRLPLARARNLGAQAARSSRLVFLDVDCLAGPSLVGAYRRALDELAAQQAGPVVVAGPVTYLPEGWDATSPAPQVDWPAVRGMRRPHAARPDPAPGELLHEDRLELFWSLSFALRATDLARIGGFDEAYEGYGGEDTDFAQRLGRAGGSLWWVGGADAYHQHHAVSRPPLEHLDDIVRNASLFQQQWGRPCMDGWLESFATLGLVARDDDGTWRRRRPDEREEVLHVVAGADGHGITRHALQLVTEGSAPHLRLADPAAMPPERLADLVVRAADGRPVHLHLNDTLLGDATVDVVGRVAARLPVSLTLHDLPDPREGTRRYRRRTAAYADLWRHSRGVVVSSHHEHALLARAAGGEATAGDLPPVAVVPLPLAAPAGPCTDPAALEPVVGVLGWVYPGKGHHQALDVAAALGLGVVALGAVSDGHQGFVDELAARAAELGVAFEVTGFLDEDDLLERARRVAVPLAWHAHLSASGSIGTWLQAGRRPLVATGGWTRELDARCPGSVTLVATADDLAGAAAAALAEPSATVLSDDVRLGPTASQAWDATRAAVARFHHPEDPDGH